MFIIGVSLISLYIYWNKLDWKLLSLILSLMILCGVFLSIGIIEFINKGINIISSLLIPLGFAILSIILALTSENRMKSIGQSEYLGAMGNILRVRLEYFNRIRELNTERDGNDFDTLDDELKDEYNRCIEYATWQTFVYLRQVLVSKRYMEPKDKKRLFYQIEIIFDNVISEELIPILTNRHVEHLFMSLKEAYNAFEEFKCYEPRRKSGYLVEFMEIIRAPDINVKQFLDVLIGILNAEDLDGDFRDNYHILNRYGNENTQV